LHYKNYGIRQTRFFTFCGPMDGKSEGIAATLSSLAFGMPAKSNPFLHIRANLIGWIC